MRVKVHEKARAIKLRRQGYSYNDIQKYVPVAKSSLSEWLKDLPLTKDEKKVLRHRNNANITRGRIKAASEHRKNRISRERRVFSEARESFEKMKSDPVFLCGVSLYWAEGSKRQAPGFRFVNSDKEMIKFMVWWCKRYLLVNEERLWLRIFIHRHYAHEECERAWSEFTGVPLAKFKTTIYKPSIKIIKKRPQYIGCARIEITKSTDLLRKMQCWQQLMLKELTR